MLYYLIKCNIFKLTSVHYTDVCSNGKHNGTTNNNVPTTKSYNV